MQGAIPISVSVVPEIRDGAIEDAGPDGDGSRHAIGEALALAGGIDDDAASLGGGEEGGVEVEAGGAEGAVVGVAIGGLEVAGGVEVGGVPEAATEVGEERELRPELRDLADEDGVLVYRSQCVVHCVFSLLYASRRSVYAHLTTLFFYPFHLSLSLSLPTYKNSLYSQMPPLI